MTTPMSEERLAEIQARTDAATPGPWEPGAVWLLAGVIFDKNGKRVGPDLGSRCGLCHHGEPVWSGRTRINGTLMNAHRHRNTEPWQPEHLISAANGDLVAGNFDYEEGGLIAPADTEFVAAARQDVPDLLAEVKRLRAERARAVAALGDIGRAAEAASGDLEDGINAELMSARAEREQLARSFFNEAVES